MDVNCGDILDGEATVEEVGQQIFTRILQTASGERTQPERLGYGHHEFVPWFVSAVM